MLEKKSSSTSSQRTSTQPHMSPNTKVNLIHSQLHSNLRISRQRKPVLEQIARPQHTSFDTIQLLLEDRTSGVLCENHECSDRALARLQVFVQASRQVVGFQDEQNDAGHFAEHLDELLEETVPERIGDGLLLGVIALLGD